MHLDDYLGSAGYGAATRFARATGLSDASVSRMRRDAFWPSREQWARIVAVTEGRVTPDDHLDGPPPKENANGGRQTTPDSHQQL